MKLKKLTKKALREFLEAHPKAKHRCGDVEACVIADFYAEQIPADHMVSVSPRYTGGFLSWDGTKYPVTADATERGLVEIYGPERENEWDRPLVAEFELPKWADKFAGDFDNLKEGERVTSTFVLKHLGDQLK